MLGMDRTVNDFLKGLMEFDFEPSYTSDKDRLKQEIYALLTPEWFRFGPVEKTIEDFLRKGIESCVESDKPIAVLNAMGGFKNYRIDTAPHIDWAEVFHLSFFSKTLLRICEIYKPGVTLEYSGDSHMACIVDNIKKEWVDTYIWEFDNLIDIFNKSTPNNLRLTHKHFLDFYSYDEMKTEINEWGDREDLESPKNKELIEKNYQRARQNFCFEGLVDLSDKTDTQKEDMVRRSVLKAYKWYDLDFEKRKDYFASFIPVCNLKDFPESYCVRSIRHLPCPPFWQGKGVLEVRGDEVHAVILHNKKYLEEVTKLNVIKVDKPPLAIDSLTIIGAV